MWNVGLEAAIIKRVRNSSPHQEEYYMKHKMHFVTYFFGGVLSGVLIKKCVFAATNNIALALIAYFVWAVWYSIAIAHDICRE